MTALEKKFYKSIGLSDKTISTIEKLQALKPEEEKDFNIDEPTTEAKDHLVNILIKTEGYVKKEDAETAAAGKFLNILDRNLKKKGLTKEEIDGKEIDEKIEIFAQKLTAGTSADVKKVQDENLALIGKIKDYEEVQIPKIRSEVENTKTEFQVNQHINELLGGYKLKVKPQTILPALKSAIASKYDLKVKDNNVVIFEKGKELQPKNKSGNGFLTTKDFVQDWLTENEAVEKDVEPGKKNVVEVITDKNKNSVIGKHIAEAQEHLSELKQK